MSAWLESALARAGQLDDWLAPKRQASLALLREASWPTRKTEAWKYTSLYPLQDASFTVQAAAPVTVEAIDGLDSIDLVFINGQLQSLPAELPAGLSVVSIKDAAAGDKAWALDAFASIKPARHLFGLVNDVLANSGVLIHVAENVTLERPLRIIHVLSEGAEAHSRVLVKLETGACAAVIEQSVGNQAGFNTTVAEYAVGASAQLEHYRFALQTANTISIGGSHFRLAAQAQLNSTLVGFGSKLSRLDVDVEHAGEHATANLNAIYLLDGDELFDLHSTIEHAVPHGTTEENVRGIVAGGSRAVFNGRIHIHRHAQKTLAELNNRNLLLSRQAEVDTKPELEIYADDVRCAHGATIAEVDKKALYYLQSRGVDKAQAQVMLNFGFINELVDLMPNQALAEWLRPQLRQRFAQMNTDE